MLKKKSILIIVFLVLIVFTLKGATALTMNNSDYEATINIGKFGAIFNSSTYWVNIFGDQFATNFSNSSGELVADLGYAKLVNYPPVIERVFINKTPAETTDDLRCLNLSYDRDSPNVTVYYKWYVNSKLNSTNQNFSNTNTSLNDNITCSQIHFDGEYNSSHGWVNSSVLVIGDSSPPSFKTTELEFNSLYTDQVQYIYTNITDTGSNIYEVNVTLEDPDGIITINPMGLYEGVNAPNSVQKYRKTKSSMTVGTWYVRNFTASDSSGNYQRLTSSLSFEVNPRVGGGGTTGGGAPSERVVIIVNETLPRKFLNITCGDGICQEWETPLNCFQDCGEKLNIDNILCITGEDCIWKQFWFVKILFGFLGAVGLYVFYKQTQKKNKKKS